MAMQRPWTDPLHVSVPPELVVELLRAVAADLTDNAKVTEELVDALGGEPRCWERFLIARNMSVAAAATMLRGTLAFRAGLQPLTLATKLRVSPFWPGAFSGRTRDGSPLIIMRLGAIDPRGIMEAVTEDEFRAYYVHWMETSLAHQRACGGAKTVEVYDLRGLSFSQMYMPGLKLLARTLKLGQNNYMESLHRSVIVNSPLAFKVAWAVISVVLNERTRQKTKIYSDDGSAYLQELTGLGKLEVDELLEGCVDSKDREGFAYLPAGACDALRAVDTDSAAAQPPLECDAASVRLRRLTSWSSRSSTALVCAQVSLEPAKPSPVVHNKTW